jgi:maleylacetate reductase
VTAIHETPARRVVFGAGAVDLLPGELERLGVRRPLVIAGSSQAAAAARLLDAAGAGESILGVRVHVPVAIAEEARERARALGADGLVAIGGGSAVGLAKAVALARPLPIAAVPTTYAGSELTSVWGLTQDGRKTTGRDAAVAPRLVVYDPELTYGLPPAVTGASGMNAVAHCVEALWAPGASPPTDAAAVEGLRRLATGLSGSLRAPADAAARATALEGAWLAGEAFDAGGALHHKLCHVLGGMYDLPHAELHAALLPFTTGAIAPAAPVADRRIAEALGGPDAATAVAALARDLGTPTSLAALGLDETAVVRAAAVAAPELPAEPLRLAREELEELLRRALRGLEG